MRLDHRAYIFQNLNGAVDEIELKIKGNTSYAVNTIYDTTAAVLHGNGPSKVGHYCSQLLCRHTHTHNIYVINSSLLITIVK